MNLLSSAFTFCIFTRSSGELKSEGGIIQLSARLWLRVRAQLCPKISSGVKCSREGTRDESEQIGPLSQHEITYCVIGAHHQPRHLDKRLHVMLLVACSLQTQLFSHEVEWGGRMLQDGVEDVYMFLGDQEGGSDAAPEREELPMGIMTMDKVLFPELRGCYAGKTHIPFMRPATQESNILA
ncbi:hypothetical protein C8R45DRAFT_1154875 [Mycena sanguinolenta]|nr:hypothetical protein C8R45DRAFT_1154875 [Mycena sanguinolenta]